MAEQNVPDLDGLHKSRVKREPVRYIPPSDITDDSESLAQYESLIADWPSKRVHADGSPYLLDSKEPTRVVPWIHDQIVEYVRKAARDHHDKIERAAQERARKIVEQEALALQRAESDRLAITCTECRQPEESLRPVLLKLCSTCRARIERELDEQQDKYDDGALSEPARSYTETDRADLRPSLDATRVEYGRAEALVGRITARLSPIEAQRAELNTRRADLIATRGDVREIVKLERTLSVLRKRGQRWSSRLTRVERIRKQTEQTSRHLDREYHDCLAALAAGRTAHPSHRFCLECSNPIPWATGEEFCLPAHYWKHKARGNYLGEYLPQCVGCGGYVTNATTDDAVSRLPRIEHGVAHSFECLSTLTVDLSDYPDEDAACWRGQLLVGIQPPWMQRVIRPLPQAALPAAPIVRALVAGLGTGDERDDAGIVAHLRAVEVAAAGQWTLRATLWAVIKDDGRLTRALARLLDRGVIERSGLGKRGDPYLYRLV